MCFVGRRRDSPISVQILNILEKKGGSVALNTEEDLAEVSESSTYYVLKKTITVNTPTPPSGLTVYKYALLISFAIKYVTASACSIKVDVDDITLVEITPFPSTSYTYYDRSKEVTAGAHTVKFYLKSPETPYEAYLKDARCVCGIGTIGTSDTKVASATATGDAKLTAQFGSKCWEADVNVTGTVTPDEDLVDKAVDTQAVVKGGTLYQKIVEKTTYALVEGDAYGRTDNANVPMFLFYKATKSLRMTTY